MSAARPVLQPAVHAELGGTRLLRTGAVEGGGDTKRIELGQIKRGFESQPQI